MNIKNTISFRHHLVSLVVRVVTVLFIFMGLFVPNHLIQPSLGFIALLFILAGIPHGAADHLIFGRLTNKQKEASSKLSFYFYYLVLLLCYGAVWWFYPVLAFLIFLAISIYHFGQSNWSYLSFNTSLFRIFTYMLWGSFVTLIPILLYQNEAQAIISSITGTDFQMVFDHRWPLIFLIFFTNILVLSSLLENGKIDFQGFSRELINILLLLLLFFSTPLLIGFAVYFVFWHSLSAILDQIKLFKQSDSKFNLKKYLLEVIPLSAMALAGLGILYTWVIMENERPADWGLLFLFISLITIPHALLMDRFLERSADSEILN